MINDKRKFCGSLKTSVEGEEGLTIVCFTLAQKVSDRRAIAIARFNLGCSLDRHEDYDRAFSIFEESFASFQELNDPYWAAISYKWLSTILVAKGNCDLAEIAMESVELARKAGERKLLGETLSELSLWHFRNSQLNEAEKYSREADLLLKEIASNMNTTTTFYADIAWATGKFQEAELIYKEFRNIWG